MLTQEEIIQMNDLNCPCKRIKCERYNDCEACREYHKNKKTLARCEKLEKKEQRRAGRRRNKESENDGN